MCLKALSKFKGKDAGNQSSVSLQTSKPGVRGQICKVIRTFCVSILRDAVLQAAEGFYSHGL